MTRISHQKFNAHHKFIGAIAGLSILITSFAAAPARAGDDDVARALAALVGIAIIGAAINDARDDRHVKPKVHTYSGVNPRPLPPRVRRNILPQKCFRVFTNNKGGRMPAFGHRCLQNSYAYANALPHRCLRNAKTNRGLRPVYGARCLRQEGYQLSRR
jgi:hypothetical protein